jgi:hypothetical protein
LNASISSTFACVRCRWPACLATSVSIVSAAGGTASSVALRSRAIWLER